jgi:hypothetical protein
VSTKKNFRSIASSLAPKAAELPTQNVATSRPTPAAVATPAEEIVQFSFGLRKSLRKELARLAADEDMTMRAFILDALKEKGLSVTDEDLLDLRKR